ncbi:MAG: class I SAM-dependent methyltransferase [bacterium]|nr:class I SAM-dependent methyltransferase [bacterium]
MGKITSCPACTGESIEPGPRVREVELFRCGSCSLLWWDWEEFDPKAFYQEGFFRNVGVETGFDDYAQLETSMRKTSRSRLGRIERFVQPDARNILDIGCGMGFFLDEVQSRGWKAAGIEISEYAGLFARERFNLEVSIGAFPLEVTTTGGPFDVVTLWDAIEHFKDPRASLETVHGLLRLGGLCVLTTGDVSSLVARLSGSRWHLYSFPEHLFFYSPRSIRALLESVGFRVTALKYESAHYTLGYLLERLDKTLLGLGPRWRGFTAKLPGASCIIPFNLFDIMTVYAFK